MPREATRSDLPVLNTNQTQCVLCWRLFASDTVCEQHKPYARLPEDEGKRGRIAAREDCTEPKALGMNPWPRADGIIVWSFMTEEDVIEKQDRMETARAARKTKGNS